MRDPACIQRTRFRSQRAWPKPEPGSLSLSLIDTKRIYEEFLPEAASLHELSRPAIRPRIISQTKLNPVGNARMAVKKKNIHGIRIGISQINLAKGLERLCRHLRRIRRQTMRHFKTILVRLMLIMPAKRARNRICQKRKHRQQKQQRRQ